MANNSEMNIRGNRVKFIDGHLYVNGHDLNLKQWESDPKMWSNRYGTKQSEYSGKSLEEVLKMKGYLGPCKLPKIFSLFARIYGSISIGKSEALTGLFFVVVLFVKK